MTDYTWPTAIVPAAASWRSLANTAAFGARARVRAGDRWACTLTMPIMSRERAFELRAFLARLRGQSHRAVVPVFGYNKRGASTTNALVAGASQTGTTLVMDGVEAGLTNALRTGDFIGVEGRLYMVAADADSTAGGVLTVTLTNPMDTAPADNAAVLIVNPTARFMLSGQVGWQNLPLGRAAIAPLEFFEDIP